MTGKLEVRLLGPFEVVVAGKTVDVPDAKRQALVACLALGTGRVVPTDTLVEPYGGRRAALPWERVVEAISESQGATE